MKRKNVTRNALFTSIISLLLCVSMLVGTTFAWFTDSVVSGNNVIAAGNLDVELYHSDKDESNVPVNSDTKLFNDVVLWEPGAVLYDTLQVKNVGSLALKYDLALTVLNETVVNEHKLSEVIKVGVIDRALDANTTRDGLIAAVSSWTPLAQFNLNKAGVPLEVNGEDTVTLVLYWQPNSNEIDNLYNMNNTNQGKELRLEIGVNLYATQVEAESDSFGIDYDAGAYIEDDAALEDALTQNKETIIVNLTSDVTWDVAAWENHPMGGELTKTIAINGNGHTITFNKTNSDWTNIVTGDAVLIIENATITDSGYDATSGTWNGHDITFAGEVKLNNVVSLSALALMDNATLNDVTLTDDSTGDAYGLWIRPNGQTVTIDGLKMDMTTTGGDDRGIKIDNQYAESTDNGVTLSVKNSSFKTEKKGAILVKSTGNVNITLENVDISGVAADPINPVWIDEDNAAYADKTTVTGGTKVIEGSDAPEVVTDGLYKDQSGNYYISNANGMLYLSAKALTGNNGTAETATLSLLNDIDMGGANFSAIIAQRGDTLTFNGNGHTISNVKVISGENDNTTGQASMFYAYPNSTLNVSELILENITVKADENGTGYAAAVVGYCEGTANLTDVDVVNATIVGVKSSGALIGHLSGSLTATNCDVSGTVTLADFAEEANGHYAGKYIGTMAGAAALNNCTANVTVSGNLNAANDGTVYGRKTAAGSLTVDGALQKTASTQSELAAAVSSGEKVDVELSAGNYTLPSAVAGKEVTISGSEDTVIDVTSGLSYATGADVTFEGVTIQSEPEGAGYTNGFADCKYATFNNCVIDGTIGLDFSCEFNNCEFNIQGNYYNVWTWGAGTATFNGCTFNCDGKALLVYANVLDNGTYHQTVNITNCVFNDNGDDTVTGKAAIEITNTYTPVRTYDVFINNTTVNGFAQTVPGAGDFNAAYGSVEDGNIGTNVWGNKCKLSNEYLNVVIDGVDVY